MDKHVDTKFNAGDDVLEKLVSERRNEVVQLQQAQAEHGKRLEAHGQQRMAELRKALPKDFTDVLDKLDKMHQDQKAAAESQIREARGKLIASRAAPEDEADAKPGTAQALMPAALVATVTPYYAVLHGSDGSVYWQGYNPGNIDLSDQAWGNGSGLFGTGAGSFTVYLDWWFNFRPPDTRWYSHYIYTLYHGFYIVRADDGWWDSKEATVRIDQSAIGYQYNYKALANMNVLSVSSQNIDVNYRLDSWRYQYYSDQLGGGDLAYLRVSASFYVYARGGGSYAELNFSDGVANYMGTPTVYVY